LDLCGESIEKKVGKKLTFIVHIFLSDNIICFKTFLNDFEKKMKKFRNHIFFNFQILRFLKIPLWIKNPMSDISKKSKCEFFP